jgi:hypothetical protein
MHINYYYRLYLFAIYAKHIQLALHNLRVVNPWTQPTLDWKYSWVLQLGL